MSRFLTSLLSRAVPGVRVWKVEVVESLVPLQWSFDFKKMTPYPVKLGVAYSFDVRPEPYIYWRRFREIYPHWKQVAYKYRSATYSVTTRKLCPEFSSRGMLIDWLSDVLSLSPGERNLLYLMEGKIRCRGC